MSKQETRERILSAAEELFSQNGFNGTVTKAIAVKARVTEMTLYNHFPNKELLYKTLVKERFLAVDLQGVFMELTYTDLESDLLMISKQLVKSFLCNKNILLMRIKEKQSFKKDNLFTVIKDPLIKLLIPVFEIYVKRGLIKGLSQDNALLFVSATKGLFYVSLIDDKVEEEISDLMNHFVTTFCYGMIVVNGESR